MTQDGATIAVDWELPDGDATSSEDEYMTKFRTGPINIPVVLILHGINNHANFGYVRSLARACTNRGWAAAAMNFRGCGGSQLSTPRGYNGAYTGDIRCIVQRIISRMVGDGCLFIVGNSLSANLVTKYLGEEGFSGTLPERVAAGVALGNPLTLDMRKIDWLFSPVMALGVKKTILEHWAAYRSMNSSECQTALRQALLAPTMKDFDRAVARVFIRNEPVYPFAVSVGFDDAEHYWSEASSYRYAPHITVPTLQVVAGDDFLVFHPFRGKLRHCLTNPNILVIETKCGGHLGWQESLPDGNAFGFGTSWADVVTTDFIAAVLDQRRTGAPIGGLGQSPPPEDYQKYMNEAMLEASTIRSRI